MSRFHRRVGDESGMSYVFVGMGLMAFLSASMLAIDVGMLMTSRNQAQNSADAGALAGAVALGFDDFNDRSDTGPAKTSAITAGLANKVMRGNVSVTPADVVFLPGAGGVMNRVQVTVYRNGARGNPLQNLIARVMWIATAGSVGRETSDISAVATAEVSPANAVACPLPFTIPDRWQEMNDATFDPINSDFDAVDNKGVPVAVPDRYRGPENKATYTGYDAIRDAGMPVVLKADNGSKLAPSMYQVWDVEGQDRGSDDVRAAISGCRTGDVMGYGDYYVHKPGFQAGPVEQGIADLIAQDPNARWDDRTNKPVSGLAPARPGDPPPISPRVRVIPLFDPYEYDTGTAGGRNATLKFVNYLGFYIEGMNGNEVVGRITPVGGLMKGGTFGPAPAAAFPVAIHLVK